MESNTQEEKKTYTAKKQLVWIGVASIAMFFFGLTSAYIVLQADHFWVKDSLPQMFTISTIVLLVSSITIFMAKRSILVGKEEGLKVWLLVTFLLGLGFLGTQYLGWMELKADGKFFVGTLTNLTGEYGTDYTIMMGGEPVLYNEGNYYKPGDINYLEPINDRINDTFNISGSFLYLLSGLHIIHLLGGIIWLLVLLVKAFFGKISAQNTLSLELGSIYWHFLDILWIYLFLFLLFIR